MTAPRTLLLTLALAALAGCGGSGKSTKSSSAATSAPATSATPAASPAPVASPAPAASPVSSGAVAAPSSSVGSGVAPAVALSLASVDPVHGPLDGGTQVIVRGAGFLAPGAGETLVLFGEQAVRATPTSDTELRLSAPAGAAAGAADLWVINERAAAKLASAWTFDARPPRLRFVPAVGHYELGFSGTRITLSLEHAPPLVLTPTVTFGGTPATAVALIDSHTLLAEVPQGAAAGLQDVVVDIAGIAVTAAGFRVQDPLAYGDVIVNELCAHPGGYDHNHDDVGDSKADEFVELVNTTNRPVDLTYLTIYDGAGRERHRFLNPTTLPPGGSIVVFGGGNPDGFAARHETGSAQTATADELALNNNADSIELRTLPGLNPVGTTIFKVEYDNPPSGPSFVNKNDGQRISANPATTADYEDHSAAPGAQGVATPGLRKDGSKF
ncbi:MAG: lamin tail domain-containing protein [Planctomycetota bacterium]